MTRLGDKSSFSAGPEILGKGVNCGKGELPVGPWNRAHWQKGESSLTAKP
jgi:hypothetical protein